MKSTIPALPSLMIVLMSASLGGCAGYHMTPVSPDDANATWEKRAASTDGYVFYQPQAYLIATLDSGGGNGSAPAGPTGGGGAASTDHKNIGAGPAGSTSQKASGYTFKVLQLPDYSKPYRLTRYEFLAKNDVKVTFTDGWQFTGGESNTDSTAALSSIVDFAKAIAPHGMMAAPFGTGDRPKYMIWKIEPDPANHTIAFKSVELPDSSFDFSSLMEQSLDIAELDVNASPTEPGDILLLARRKAKSLRDSTAVKEAYQKAIDDAQLTVKFPNCASSYSDLLQASKDLASVRQCFDKLIVCVQNHGER